MKLGIIGSGMIVRTFLPDLMRIGELEILGIQSTSRSLEAARALCREYRIPCATDSFAELCGTGIDTVYVAVPNTLHFPCCLQALEAGLNVIVEKPMVCRPEEFAALRTAAEERGLFLFEAITTLHLGNYQKMQEWLPRIGTVKMVQSQYSQYSSRYDSFLAGACPPVFDPAKAGGALMDLNVYNLFVVMGLFGMPESAVYYPNMDRGIDTSGIAVLTYPGFPAMCTAAKDSRGAAGALIQGTKGCIRSLGAPNQVGAVRLEMNDGSTEDFDDGWGARRVIPEFTAFIRAIQQGDHAFCEKLLDRSEQVCHVLTQLRLNAGIRFPGDAEEP